MSEEKQSHINRLSEILDAQIEGYNPEWGGVYSIQASVLTSEGVKIWGSKLLKVENGVKSVLDFQISWGSSVYE